MKLASKNNKTASWDMFINFFAFLYDSAEYFVKKSIDFFASLYDLVYDFVKLASMTTIIDFFAFQYDSVGHFIQFLQEYILWITDINSTNSSDFVAQTEKAQIHNQNPFEVR